ncbi:MAG: hypothetical protein EPN80_18955, partial [Pandoraea sp.]
YAPRFLPTLGRPHAVALHFIRCDQLVAGLTPAGVRPCWAHKKNAAGIGGVFAMAGARANTPRRKDPARRHRRSANTRPRPRSRSGAPA